MVDICRLCLNNILEPSNKLIDSDSSLYKAKIELLMPEIDINLTPTFILCNLCSHLLNTAYVFKCECIQVEKLIKNYLTQHETTLLELHLVRDFRNQEISDLKDSVHGESIKVEFRDDDIKDDIDPPSLEDHLDITFICDNCHNNFSDEETFHKHKKDCISYKCNQCDEKLLTKEDFDNHYRSHTVRKPFVCETCNKPFRRPYELKRHNINNHTGKQPLVCNLCGKTYLSESSLRDHKIFVHEQKEKTHSCDICSKSFFKPSELERHRRRHDTNHHPCDICEKVFGLAESLKRHMVNKHFSKNVCDTCGLKCVSKSALIEHIRTHTGERPFRCEVCGKGFAQRSTLEVHKKSIHDDEKPFVCETCGKSFSVRGSLTKHIITHTGDSERKFICVQENCNKRFRRRGDLRSHMLRHIGAKSHKCSLCDKAFFEATGLKKHMRIHTGERPFECYTCHKQFSQRYNLQVHFKSHRPKIK